MRGEEGILGDVRAYKKCSTIIGGIDLYVHQ